MLTSVAMTAIAFGAISAAHIQAQDVSQNLLDGNWKNIDPHTRGIDVIIINGKKYQPSGVCHPSDNGVIDVIVIKGMKVHPFGACYPTDCDWGVQKARRVASSGNSVYISKVRVKHHTVDYPTDRLTGITYADDQAVTCEIVDITISLLPDGRLRVDTIARFTDGSGLADYGAINYFRRVPSPFAPTTR
ncbi:MAG: hypothetical protein ABSC77_10085 [Terracidiphilus sp.]